MENRSKVYLVWLSFVPILLYPFSPVFALLLALGLMIYGMQGVNDEQITKKMLRPLLLLVVVAAVYLGLFYFFEIIHGFGRLFNGYTWSGFYAFLNKALAFLNTLFIIAMVVECVFIVLSYKTNKPVWMLDKKVDYIMFGICPFKKANKTQEPEQPTEPESEVIVETEQE